MRVMEGRNTDAAKLRKNVEDHQLYFPIAETKKGEGDQEIDDMLEVCKTQANSTGYAPGPTSPDCVRQSTEG